MNELWLVLSWGTPAGLGTFAFLVGIGTGVFLWGLGKVSGSAK